jgi:hypothetical protein
MRRIINILLTLAIPSRFSIIPRRIALIARLNFKFDLHCDLNVNWFNEFPF